MCKKKKRFATNRRGDWQQKTSTNVRAATWQTMQTMQNNADHTDGTEEKERGKREDTLDDKNINSGLYASVSKKSADLDPFN